MQRETTSRTPINNLSAQFGNISLKGRTPLSGRRRAKSISDLPDKNFDKSLNPCKTPTGQQRNAFGASSKNTISLLKRRELTPSRNADYSGVTDGDRYISMRSDEQLELASHLLSQDSIVLQDSQLNNSTSAPQSPTAVERGQRMKAMMRSRSAPGEMNLLTAGPVVDPQSNNMNGEDRILAYRKGLAPRPQAGYRSNANVLYTCMNPSSSVKRAKRHIPRTPDRILDAPGIADDFYLNIIDWSRANVMCVALGNMIWLWKAETGDTTLLTEYEGNTISTVKWSNEGKYAAIGLNDGSMKLYDVTRGACLRTIRSNMARIGCASWLSNGIISYGTRTGTIYHHDVRIPRSQIGIFENHTREVCGLKWSDDEKYLTSGGGDHLVNVWTPDQIGAEEPSCLYTFEEHLAGVKAIEYVPFSCFSTTHVATGGGRNDHRVCIWDLATGSLTTSLDTGGQITGIAFSREHREMATALGVPHMLKLWKYSSKFERFDPCIDLEGHTDRLVGLTQSPCGQYVMTAGADETLRLWNCFKVDESLKDMTNNSRKFGSQLQNFVEFVMMKR